MNMRPNSLFLLIYAGFSLLILVSIGTAVAAANSIPATHLSSRLIPVTANEVKPAACEAMELANIVSGSGTINGTDENDLIIGSSDSDTINGMGGDDCIEGAGGLDTIYGGTGSNVCYATAGSDLSNCASIVAK